MKTKLMLLIILVFLSHIFLSKSEKKVQLYYANSSQNTVNGIEIYDREFYVKTTTLNERNDTDQCKEVFLYHKTKASDYWDKLKLDRVNEVNNSTIIWHYRIIWTSLGSEYKYDDFFSFKCITENNKVYYEDNKYQNFYLPTKGGLLFGRNFGIIHKLNSISCKETQETNDTYIFFSIKMDIFVKTISKNSNVLLKIFVEKNGNIDYSEPILLNAIFSKKMNLMGIEEWNIETTEDLSRNANSTITSCPKTIKYYLEVEGESIKDDNFGMNYTKQLESKTSLN